MRKGMVACQWFVLWMLALAGWEASAQAPVITKAFYNPQSQSSTVQGGQPATLYFTIFNPSGGDITNVAFTDTFPANLFVFTPNNLTGSCGAGTITAVAGSNSVSLTGGTIPANSSCSFSVDVISQHQTVAQLDYTNTTSAVTASSGTGNTASATLTVVANGTSFIAKGFDTNLIFAGIGTSTLRFTVTSSQTTTTANGLAQTQGIVFRDTLPAGVVIASPNNLNTGTCGALGATITAPFGGNTIQMGTSLLNTGGNTGGVTLVQSGGVPDTCSFSVDVTAANPGTYVNTIAEAYAGGNIQVSNSPGTNSATLSVHAATPAPSISKSFAAPSIAVNGTTTLTFTLTNPNPQPATGVAFTDLLPSGLTVADASVPACGGTLTTQFGNTISLAGGTIAANSACTIPVTVTATTNGIKINVTSVITSTDSGSGQSASALLTVISPPSLTKFFDPSTVAVGGTSKLNFSISNPNAGLGLTGIAFTDTLPAGLLIKTPNGLTGTCGGGTITAVAGSASVSLSGAALAASGFCTFSVDVVASTVGTKLNTTSAVTANETPPGAAGVASLLVAAPPSMTKTFGADNIALNGVTSLTFQITNPNTDVTLTGVGFTDNLPAGLVVATPNGLTGDCGGGAITATAGSASIGLSGGVIAPSGTCTFAVNVMGTTPGVKANTTTPVVSTEGGQGAAASDSVTVASPPTIAKAFGAGTVTVGGGTSLTFTIANPNAGLALTGVQFTDNLPAGVVVATPNGLTGSCGAGTITATAGSGSISLTGGTIAASGNCTFAVNVQGTTAGVKVNTTGAISTTETGAGGTATATLTVLAAPSIAKAFGAPTIPLGGTTSLTLTITNPNATTALGGVAVTDTLPAGLAVAAVPNVVANCNGGSVQVQAGNTGFSLTGGSVPAAGSCLVTLDVVGTAAGHQVNNTGNVTSANGGSGNAATASIEVVAPPVIQKSFVPSSIFVGGTSQLTFTITNPAANTVPLTGVGFTDNLQNMIVGAVSGSCGGGTITATPGSSSVSLSGATLPVGGSCTFSVAVVPTTVGLLQNVTSAVVSTEGGAGNSATAALESRLPVIPALSPWALGALLFATLALAGGLLRRRRV